MYPLALILGIAAWKKDRLVRVYALPLAAIGGLISAYHYLIQQFPNLSSGECSATVPCTAAYIWEFGFVSIPYMALSSFALIIVLLAVAYVNDRVAPIEAPADTEVHLVTTSKNKQARTPAQQPEEDHVRSRGWA